MDHIVGRLLSSQIGCEITAFAFDCIMIEYKKD